MLLFKFGVRRRALIMKHLCFWRQSDLCFLNTGWCIWGRNIFLKQMYGISEKRNFYSAPHLFSPEATSSLVGVQLLDPRPNFFFLLTSSFIIFCEALFSLATVSDRPPVNPQCAQWRLQLESLDREALIQAEYNAADCCPLLILILSNPPGLCCSYWISGCVSNLQFQLCYETLSLELWNVSHTFDAMIKRSPLWRWYKNWDRFCISIKHQQDMVLSFTASTWSPGPGSQVGISQDTKSLWPSRLLFCSWSKMTLTSDLRLDEGN